MDTRSLASNFVPKSSFSPESTRLCTEAARQLCSSLNIPLPSRNGRQFLNVTNQPSQRRRRNSDPPRHSDPPSLTTGSTPRTGSEAVTVSSENASPPPWRSSWSSRQTWANAPQRQASLPTPPTVPKQYFSHANPRGRFAPQPTEIQRDFPANEAQVVVTSPASDGPPRTQSFADAITEAGPSEEVPRNPSTLTSQLHHPGERRLTLEHQGREPSEGPPRPLTPIPVVPAEVLRPIVLETIKWQENRHPRHVTPPPPRRRDKVKARLRKWGHNTAEVCRKMKYRWEKFYTVLHEPGWQNRLEGNKIPI